MPYTIAQLDTLAAFFKDAKLPKSIALDTGSTITDITKFIQGHLAVLRSNPDKPIYEPFYTRLVQLRSLLSGKP